MKDTTKGKVLFVANITKHILRFHLPYLQWFQNDGYETHVASNGDEKIPYCNVKHNFGIERSPFSLKNISAYNNLKQIIESEKFELIHCHTPMGGVLARLASRKNRRNGNKTLYTAHGFHFFKGAPIINWLLYYPVEKYLSKFTDGLITINAEDYHLCLKKNFKAKEILKINGVGVDNLKFTPVNKDVKSELRRTFGYKDSDFILIYVAEFIPRKNHRFILDSVNEIKKQLPELKVIFAGRGVLLESMKAYAKQINVNKSVDFLGFRSDIAELIQLSDIGISASKQEGLGLNIAEEMFCGLPIVATVDRGHNEMIEHGKNGYVFAQNNQVDFIKYVIDLYQNPEKREKFGEYSNVSIQKFSLPNALESMIKIYKQYLPDE